MIRVRYDKVRRLKRARSGSVRWDVWVALCFEYTYRVQYGMLTQSGKNTPIPRAPTTAYPGLIAGYSKKTYSSSSTSLDSPPRQSKLRLQGPRNNHSSYKTPNRSTRHQTPRADIAQPIQQYAKRTPPMNPTPIPLPLPFPPVSHTSKSSHYLKIPI